MSDTVFEIQPLVPMALLDVDNTVDNEFWRFCADDVMDDDGRILEDSELTYDEFELGPEAILPAGTRVVMPGLWGLYNDEEKYFERGSFLTSRRDFEVVLPKPATVKHVVHVILSQYHELMQSKSADGRFYFIEAVFKRDDSTVEIAWGT